MKLPHVLKRSQNLSFIGSKIAQNAWVKNPFATIWSIVSRECMGEEGWPSTSLTRVPYPEQVWGKYLTKQKAATDPSRETHWCFSVRMPCFNEPIRWIMGPFPDNRVMNKGLIRFSYREDDGSEYIIYSERVLACLIVRPLVWRQDVVRRRITQAAGIVYDDRGVGREARSNKSAQ